MLGDVYFLSPPAPPIKIGNGMLLFKPNHPKKAAFVVSRTGDSLSKLIHGVQRIFQKKNSNYQKVNNNHFDIVPTEVLQSYWMSYQKDSAALSNIKIVTECASVEEYLTCISREEIDQSGREDANQWGAEFKSQFERARGADYVWKHLGDYLKDEEFDKILKKVISEYFEPNSEMRRIIETSIDEFLQSKCGKQRESTPRDVKDSIQREVCRRYLLMEVVLFYFLVRDYRAVLYSGAHLGIMKWAAEYHGKQLAYQHKILKFDIEKFWCSSEPLIADNCIDTLIKKSTKIASDQVLSVSMKTDLHEYYMGTIQLIEASRSVFQMPAKEDGSYVPNKRNLTTQEVIDILKRRSILDQVTAHNCSSQSDSTAFQVLFALLKAESLKHIEKTQGPLLEAEEKSLRNKKKKLDRVLEFAFDELLDLVHSSSSSDDSNPCSPTSSRSNSPILFNDSKPIGDPRDSAYSLSPGLVRELPIRGATEGSSSTSSSTSSSPATNYLAC